MDEAPRRVWYWIAPGLILGAAFAGSVFADWLNDKAANTSGITGEVLVWGIVAQLLTVSIATILIVLLEDPSPWYWGALCRHSVLVCGVGVLLFLGSLDGGHMSDLLGYGALQAAAAVVANAGVLGFVQLRSRRVAA